MSISARNLRRDRERSNEEDRLSLLRRTEEELKKNEPVVPVEYKGLEGNITRDSADNLLRIINTPRSGSSEKVG